MENKEFENRFARLTDQELNKILEMAWQGVALKVASSGINANIFSAAALKAAAQVYFMAYDTREAYRESIRKADPAINSDGMPIGRPF